MAKARKKSPLTLAEQLREAITESGLTLYRIAKDADVEHATMSRFMSGERDMRLSSAGQIAELLGLQLSKRRG